MRHRVAGNKLGRTSSHRAAMCRNMAVSLVMHERVITTPAKAKVVKPFIEKLVTLAKDKSQAHRRRVFDQLRDKAAATKMFEVLGPRFATRPGGYCRILRMAKNRLGDNGERALLEFVERTPKEETPAAEPATAGAKKKSKPASAKA